MFSTYKVNLIDVPLCFKKDEKIHHYTVYLKNTEEDIVCISVADSTPFSNHMTCIFRSGLF